jgi:hypothetical protein
VKELIAYPEIASNVAPMLAKAIHDKGSAGGTVTGSGLYGGTGPAPNTPDDPRLQAALNVKAETEAIDRYTKTVVDMFGKDPRTIRHGEGEGGPAEAGAKPAVPALQLGGGGGGGKKDDPAKDAAEDAAHWVKIWTDAAGKQEAALDGALKRHQISTAQWLTGTEDALQDELQDTLATYQKELQTANLTAQQRKAISDKMTEAIAANELKIVKAQQKAADESVKSWDEAMKSINGAFDSQISGLLTGTETWHKAFTNVLQDLTEQLIKFGVNKVLEGGEGMLQGALGIGQTGGGGVAGAATNTALTGLTAAWGFHAAVTTTATAAITANTGVTFASIGASISNTVATIANTIATDIAAVEHMLGFAEGTPYIQQTGVALVHAGEIIVPAHLNPNNPSNSLGSSFGGQGSAGNGGGDVHHHHYQTDFHVHAHDTQSVKDFFHENGDHIADSLHKYLGGNMSLGSAWRR